MRSFLEKLYFENLDTQARGYWKNRHILKVSENINELEDKLTQRLNDEEKKLFLDFATSMENRWTIRNWIPSSSASDSALK